MIAAGARGDLSELIRTHSLPPNTAARVQRSLRLLREFPRAGAELSGRYADRRFVLGPWRWMIIVYRCYEDLDLVAVVAIFDGRSSASPRAR